MMSVKEGEVASTAKNCTRNARAIKMADGWVRVYGLDKRKTKKE